MFQETKAISSAITYSLILFLYYIFEGVESVSVDMKDKQLTLVGEIDPVHVVGKLRKLCPHAEMVSVGPAKEDKKPDDNYSTFVSDIPPTVYEAHPLYYQMRPPLYNHYYYGGSVEENPNGCVIC